MKKKSLFSNSFIIKVANKLWNVLVERRPSMQEFILFCYVVFLVIPVRDKVVEFQKTKFEQRLKNWMETFFLYQHWSCVMQRPTLKAKVIKSTKEQRKNEQNFWNAKTDLNGNLAIMNRIRQVWWTNLFFEETTK